MIEEIIAKLKEYDKIIIHRHVRPDPDAYGSQGGLAEIIRHSFPEKKVYAAGKDEPTLLYLNRMDRLSDGDFEGALIIVCDTANEERIDDERYKLGDFLIKIDHHPDLEPYGDLSWVDPGASSTSEMIYELFLRGKDGGSNFPRKAPGCCMPASWEIRGDFCIRTRRKKPSPTPAS